MITLAFNLRKLEPADADVLFRWRNSDSVRAYMFTDHLINIDEHQRWFARTLKEESAQFLILEWNGKPCGVAHFTSLKPDGRCSWGFYLGETGLPKGSGSALAKLALNYAFHDLRCTAVLGDVFAFNEKSVQLHQRFGFKEVPSQKTTRLKKGRQEDVLHFELTRDHWTAV